MYEQFKDFTDGFGTSSETEVAELNKALTAGYSMDHASMTGGSALRVESLESSLKVLSFRDEHCKMFKQISKAPAFSTVEEFSQLNNYGTNSGAFTPEGTLPEEDDATYTRKTNLVKFLGTTRRVTHPMALVRTIGGEPVMRETNNGILKLMKDIENSLFWADSSLYYTGGGASTGIEFDGLNALVDKTNDLDLKNANITQKDVRLAAQIVAQGFGTPNALFGSYDVCQILSDSVLDNQRYNYPQISPDGRITVGSVIQAVSSNWGNTTINPDFFLGYNSTLRGSRSPMTQPPASATSTKAPSAPQSIVGGVMAGTDGEFRSASQTGNIFFQATAVNRYGESAPCALSDAVDTTGNLTKHIPLTITNPNDTSAAGIDYFNIYASTPGSSATYLIASVACADRTQNTGTSTYNYTGYIMPKTSIAFVGDMSDDVWDLRQLAPLMKMDLATIEPSYRFMILAYMTPRLSAPKKWMRIVNIKVS